MSAPVFAVVQTTPGTSRPYMANASTIIGLYDEVAAGAQVNRMNRRSVATNSNRCYHVEPIEEAAAKYPLRAEDLIWETPFTAFWRALNAGRRLNGRPDVLYGVAHAEWVRLVGEGER